MRPKKAAIRKGRGFLLLCVISKEVIQQLRREATHSRSRTTDMTERIRGRRWMRIRERIMRRDCSLCQTCKRKGRITLAAEVDHITALDNGGSNDDDNLESICAECHKAKTAKDTGKRRRPMIGPDGWPVA